MVELSLNERAFDAFISGTKTVEIRAHSKKIEDIQEEDIISFTSLQEKRVLQATVQRKQHYKTIRELLVQEGTKRTLSSTNNIEKGITSIESIPGYKERIAKNGVFAIEMKDIRSV
jgi:ASC-1-like (ASCH) protein